MTHLAQTPVDTDTSGAASPTLSPSAGSSRVWLLGVSHEQTGTTTWMNAFTVGGQTPVLFNRATHGSSTNNAYSEFYYLLEPQIAALSANPAFSCGSPGNDFFGITVFELSGRDQNPANWTWNSNGSDTATAATLSLDAGNDFDVCAILTCTIGTTGGSFSAGVTEVAGTDRTFNGTATRQVAGTATTSTDPLTITGDIGSSSGSTWQLLAAVGVPPAAAGATISSGTPSGAIGTQRRVTLGATSTQSTGTFYGVISATEADITGITAAQVYAGQYAGGGAATLAGNAAVTDSTPSVEITGLTPATTYYYAVMHRVGTENSNVISTGSFTTAVATSTTTLTLRDGAGALLNAQTLNFWTRTGLNTAAVDGGTSGLSVTCDASGVFTFTGLSVDAGAGFLTVQNPSDNTYSANYPVTFVAGV